MLRGFPWTTKPWLAAVGASLVALAFVALTIMEFGPGRTYEMWRHGRVTTGTVTGLNLSDHGGCGFQYEVAGKTYKAKDERCGDEHAVGDALTVTYLTAHPQTASTESGSQGPRNALIVGLGVPTMAAIAAGANVLSQNKRRKSPPTLG
jgi:hypothetical protein